jgi:hypothetical protein
VRNGGNNVELIAWESTGTALTRKGSATGPATSNGPMATVALSSSQVITATETDNGILQLTSWSVSSTGAVTLGSSTIAQNAQVLSMAKLDPSHVIVAFADLGGGLELSLFSVSTNGTITYETTQIALTAANMTGIAAISSSQVVTAFQNGYGDLVLISWSVNANELLGPMSITQQESASARSCCIRRPCKSVLML